MRGGGGRGVKPTIGFLVPNILASLIEDEGGGRYWGGIVISTFIFVSVHFPDAWSRDATASLEALAGARSFVTRQQKRLASLGLRAVVYVAGDFNISFAREPGSVGPNVHKSLQRKNSRLKNATKDWLMSLGLGGRNTFEAHCAPNITRQGRGEAVSQISQIDYVFGELSTYAGGGVMRNRACQTALERSDH